MAHNYPKISSNFNPRWHGQGALHTFMSLLSVVTSALPGQPSRTDMRDQQNCMKEINNNVIEIQIIFNIY